jgi:pimeloyl-ACP methyl ester carboxylesterase
MNEPTVLSAANPAATFYATNPLVRAIGTVLRLSERIAPSWGTRNALRVFFTPLPWKLTMRRSLPAPWRRETWRFEGIDLASYRRDDSAEDAPRVLLIHGWAGSGHQLRRIGDALAAAGFAPVLLDLPAHGASGGWRSNVPQFSRALFAAAARLGPLHGLVAHSLGSLAALHACARGLPVQRLALVAPPSTPAEFLDWFSASFGLPDNAGARMGRLIEQREGVPLAEFEPAWLGEHVRQPCLIAHDQGDRIAPYESGVRLASSLPGARLYSVSGLGHRRILDDATIAALVVEHLQGDRRQAGAVASPGG